MKFTVNGAIRDPSGVFFLEPKRTNEKLIQLIEKGEYVMLQGHRGSGKSTRCLYAITHQLQEYPCIWISMQTGIVVTDEPSFWNSFGARLAASLPRLGIVSQITVKDSSSFVSFFEEQAKLGKHIVLFLDEFDLLLQGDRGILDSMLSALRGMKPHRSSPDFQYGLHAVVIIGPFSVLQAANQTLSPFNVSDSIEAPYFTCEDTKELFQQYQKNSSIKLEDGIVNDIYKRTSGHPGLTCFCGKKISETLALGKATVSLAEWMEYAVFKLPLDVTYAWATVGRLVNFVSKEPYCSFLIKYFLQSDSPVVLGNYGDSLKYAR